MKYANPLMLLRIAQGDAFAVAAEYLSDSATREALKERLFRFDRYWKQPSYTIEAGHYTDDTQMSVAVARVLLGTDWSREAFADEFVRTFKENPIKGYAKGFQGLLEEVRDGTELLSRLQPHSDKNGAAMRSVPLGCIPNAFEAVDIAKRQARITHDTPGGERASVLVALMSHYALYHDQPLTNADHLRYYVEYYGDLNADFLKSLWDGPVIGPLKVTPGRTGVGMNTAHAVFTLLTTETTLLGMMRRIIEWGGDTDTVAAIAWGIGSARYRGPLPEFLERDLVGGKQEYGAEFLRKLGADLMSKFSVLS